MSKRSTFEKLKLLAQDAEDVSVVSAQVQDAIVRLGDIAYLPKSRRLALTLNRFCWECAPQKVQGREVYRRVTAGLHIENVLSVQARGLDQSNPEGLLYLLSISVDEKTSSIDLVMAGGANIRAEIEAVDLTLSDLDEGWLTEHKPAHKETGI